jgi:hypothetical protein
MEARGSNRMKKKLYRPNEVPGRGEKDNVCGEYITDWGDERHFDNRMGVFHFEDLG